MQHSARSPCSHCTGCGIPEASNWEDIGKPFCFFARFRLHGEWIYTITIRSPSVCTRASSQSCNLWCIIFYVLILRTSNMLRNKSEVQYHSMEHCLDLVMLLLSYCIFETDPPSCSDAILPKPFLRGYFLDKNHQMVDVLDTKKSHLAPSPGDL